MDEAETKMRDASLMMEELTNRLGDTKNPDLIATIEQEIQNSSEDIERYQGEFDEAQAAFNELAK